MGDINLSLTKTQSKALHALNVSLYLFPMERALAREQVRLLNRITVIPLVLVCSLAVLLALFQNRIFEYDHLLKTTDEAIKEARQAQTLLSTMESGYNSYVATRRDEFFFQYESARNQVPASLEKLKSEEIRSAFRDWVAHSESLFGKNFSEGVAIFQTTEFQRKGNSYISGIRRAFDNFITVQMETRDKQLKRVNRSRENFLTYGIALMISVALFLAWYFRRLLRSAFQKYEDQAFILEETHNELRNSLRLRDVALKSRDDFITIASHELNTPLTSLKLQVQMLKRSLDKMKPGELPNGKLHKILEQEDGQINRLVHLVEDMLSITKLGAGSLKVKPDAVQVDILVQEAVEALSDTIRASGSELSLRLQKNVMANWDRERVEQILMNLLINAIKYGEGRPVELGLSTLDGWARIEVSDLGRGIPEEARDRIFGLFERNISASEVSGLGLGLFITRQLVEAHKGQIKVESEGEGQGSKFIVEMPLNPWSGKHSERDGYHDTFETISGHWHH